MVVGYDVAHPGKPTRDEVMNKMPPQKPSVVGFSFNGAAHPECFIGDYHFQFPRREKVDDRVLNARFKWMLELFTKNREVWPENIVITRDGVSEGQYRMVIDDELGAIKEACEEFGRLNGRDPWMPRFTVVVATKRHNARFFAEKGRFIENPQPATVVDTDVVRNDITEFYMQSHRPVQGTAKPTSYQLIVDENDMGSDEVQSLMLALCFHHQIVDAPVSIPEPVYQADEWAKRGKDIWKAYT
ncbi:piwi domain protein [Ancylostoma caninum]|uniref:Piwi domain protein n=1 Tax=Ancylostoma caninum TaxID=29170 RepID=A0A368FP83_ANCCA|nr:piwi domain protein [Ancylostoma caninum]